MSRVVPERWEDAPRRRQLGGWIRVSYGFGTGFAMKGRPKPPKATLGRRKKEECRMMKGRAKPPEATPEPSTSRPQAKGLGSALLCSSCVPLVLLLFSSCSSVVFPQGFWWRDLGSAEPVPCFDSTRSLFIQMNAHFPTVALPAAVPPVADALPVSNRQP
jgi:hypothetical protein